jgi:hypothetical protein
MPAVVVAQHTLDQVLLQVAQVDQVVVAPEALQPMEQLL